MEVPGGHRWPGGPHLPRDVRALGGLGARAVRGPHPVRARQRGPEGEQRGGEPAGGPCQLQLQRGGPQRSLRLQQPTGPQLNQRHPRV